MTHAKGRLLTVILAPLLGRLRAGVGLLVLGALLSSCSGGSSDNSSALAEACEIVDRAMVSGEVNTLSDSLANDLDERVEREGRDADGDVARVVVAAQAHAAGVVSDTALDDAVDRMVQTCSAEGIAMEAAPSGQNSSAEADAVRRGCEAAELYLGELHATRIVMNASIRQGVEQFSPTGPDADYIWSLLAQVADEEESPVGSAGTLLIEVIEFCRAESTRTTSPDPVVPDQASPDEAGDDESEGNLFAEGTAEWSSYGFLSSWQAEDRDAASGYAADAMAIEEAFDSGFDPSGARLTGCEFVADEMNGVYASYLCKAVLPDAQSIEFYVDGGASAGYYVAHVGLNGNPVGWEPID